MGARHMKGTSMPETTALTGCGGFTEAERRGVKRLADRIRFELHCCQGEESSYLEKKRITLSVLDEALQP